MLFLIFFGLFVTQIILRVFRIPMVWAEECCSICYTWIVFLCASYAECTQNNIYFPLVHDALNDKAKRVVDFLHQVILIAFYLWMTPSVIGLYRFFNRKYTILLRVPLSIAYGGFLVFAVLSVIRCGYRIVQLVKGKSYLEDNEE